jgi:competence protein ComEA
LGIGVRYQTLFNTLLVLAAIAALSGGIALLLRSEPDPGIEVVLPTSTPIPELKVHISGAVRLPGVYAIRRGDRVQDVVNAAGGLLPDADVSAVNLARRVGDEEHLHIPSVGDAPLTTPEPDRRIDINSASLALLQTLPGIGEVKAKAIIDYREGNGPFQTPTDIMRVDGIGLQTYQNIRDLIRVGPASP